MNAKAQNSILVVDDSSVDLEIISLVCSGLNCAVEIASNGDEALALFRQSRPTLVLTDYQMEPMNGIEILTKVLEEDPEMPCIMMTGYPDADVRKFAHENELLGLVTKPIEVKVLMETLRVALDRYRGATVGTEGIPLSIRMDQCAPLIGTSTRVGALRKQLSDCVRSREPLLLEGARGSGKTQVAQFIHENGPYGKSHFVECRCRRLNAEELERQLLGRDGTWGRLLERARHGTLALRDIETLPIEFQQHLAKHFSRICAEMHVICMAEASLESCLARGILDTKFYFQLPTEPILVPSIADRKEDVPKIVRFLASGDSGFALPRILEAAEVDVLLNEFCAKTFCGSLAEIEFGIRRAAESGPSGTSSASTAAHYY